MCLIKQNNYVDTTAGGSSAQKFGHLNVQACLFQDFSGRGFFRMFTGLNKTTR